MKESKQNNGDMNLSEFKMALLLMKWTIIEERRWCRWKKEEITIIVDKRVSKPSITEYTKSQRHQSWHKAFQNYEAAYDYIVSEM